MYSYGGECLSFSRNEMWRIVMCGHRRECLVCLLLLSNVNVTSYPVAFRSARENVGEMLGEMLDRLTTNIGSKINVGRNVGSFDQGLSG